MANEMKFWQVDAFTTEFFKGNPAAVFVLDAPLPDEVMQNIAQEMNLSESAFILRRKGDLPLLRWFTPMNEIELCGHATLASAHVYMTEIEPSLREVTFDTRWVGSLKVGKEGGDYRMYFPSRGGEKIEVSYVPAFVLGAVSGAVPVDVRLSQNLMLVYGGEQIVRDMDPDYSALKAYDKGVIVTAQAQSEPYDFISRFFSAHDGIGEDPVTGSAHCTLAPYWADRLGKDDMFAYQASRRGGELRVEITDEGVDIMGQAVTIIDGVLRF